MDQREKCFIICRSGLGKMGSSVLVLQWRFLNFLCWVSERERGGGVSLAAAQDGKEGWFYYTQVGSFGGDSECSS